VSAGILEELLAEVKALRAELAELRAAKTAPAQLVTVEAYAAARSCSISTVRAAIREGRLASTRVGRTGRGVRVRADAEIATAGSIVRERRRDRAGKTRTDQRADRALGLA
jgi:hypothetical protein